MASASHKSIAGDSLGAEALLQELAGPATKIRLGLERMQAALLACRLPVRLPFPVVMVAGTNGKGSTVAFLEALARGAGYATAAYTSPHIWDFRERLRIRGQPLAEDRWVRALEALAPVAARIPLTYFELSTLAALSLILEEEPDLAILEVGLGGRLDAVNAFVPDLSIITSVDLDHQALLGPDRESIGREKAGILRAGGMALYGDAQNPCESVLSQAAELGTMLERLGIHFGWRKGFFYGADGWEGLAPSPMQPQSPAQWDNLALALAASFHLHHRLPKLWPPTAAWRERPILPGRCQCIQPWGTDFPSVWVDVAHNPQAIAALGKLLTDCKQGTVHAYWGMMADKDMVQCAAPLLGQVADWTLIEFPGLERAATATQLRAAVPNVTIRAVVDHQDLPKRLEEDAQQGSSRDIFLCFGSFHVLAALPPSWFGEDYP